MVKRYRRALGALGALAILGGGITACSSSGSGSSSGSVQIDAPADRWTSWTVPLGGGRLQRITLAVEAGQMPNVNRFFLDDIAIG